MPAAVPGKTPSLHSFLKTLKQNPNVEQATEHFISLLKRRQIRNPRACALGTAHLLLRVVSTTRTRNPQALIQRVRELGRRLVAAQPRELAVGNIVRRVLGVIREIAEDSNQLPSSSADTLEAGLERVMLPPAASTAGGVDGASEYSEAESSALGDEDDGEGDGEDEDSAATSTSDNGNTAKSNFANQGPQSTGSLFGIFQHPSQSSGLRSPPSSALTTSSRPTKSGSGSNPTKEKVDVKAEVIEGIKDLLDELEQVDTQIAEYALDHIHSNEIILTHTSSQTVQRFLLTAAKKRKFTVIHAEAYPNDHLSTHATIVSGGAKQHDPEDPFGSAEDDPRWKPLTALGIQVILIPDAACFALMSRVSKVVLAPHAVLADGSLLAAAGAQPIAQAARVHAVPVVVLSGVYKLGPVYPFDPAELVEFGDPGKVVPFQEEIGGEEEGWENQVDVVNPVYDWVEAGLVDLYVTNLGAHAPSYLYRIVEDHYYRQDKDLLEVV